MVGAYVRRTIKPLHCVPIMAKKPSMNLRRIDGMRSACQMVIDFSISRSIWAFMMTSSRCANELVGSLASLWSLIMLASALSCWPWA